MNASAEKPKHTSGPWEADIEDVGTLLHRAVIGPNGELVADCDAYRLSGEETAANAHLIAAAPELLTSLERLLLEFDFLVEDGTLPDIRGDVIFVDARAAVAKAEGR